MSEMMKLLKGLDEYSCVVTSNKHPFCASEIAVLSKKKVMSIVENGVSEYEREIQALTKRIQEMEKASASRTNEGWIPCSEKIPASYEVVQVTFLDFKEHKPTCNGATAFIDETGAWNWTKGSCPVNIPIIAWRENIPPYEPNFEKEKEICSEADIRNNAYDELYRRIQESPEVEFDYGSGDVINIGDIEEIIKDLKTTGEGNSGWILCETRLPENEEQVEITYIKKDGKTGEERYLTARAFHTDGDYCTLDSKYDWHDTDNWERVGCEHEEAYVIPEGWWECVSFSESFAPVDMVVVAWRPLQIAYNPVREDK